MEYSAATAPYSFGKLIFTLPHLLIGASGIFAFIKGKAKPFVGLMGVAFVAIVSYVWISDATDAVRCYRAAASSEGTPVQGYVSNVERSFSRSGEGSVHFMVGDVRVSTRTSGLNHDCGFLESLGRSYHPKTGQSVEVLLFQHQPIKLKVSE